MPNFCNLNCRLCHRENCPSFFNTNFPHLFEKLIYLRRLYEIKHFNISGGEPLCEENIQQTFLLTQFLKESFHNSIISINTNAINIDKYVLKFLKDNINYLKISLYGSNAQDYCNYTGANYFDEVLKNVELLYNNALPIKLNILMTNSLLKKGIISSYLQIANQYHLSIKFIEITCPDWFNAQQKKTFQDLKIDSNILELMILRMGGKHMYSSFNRKFFLLKNVPVEIYLYPCEHSKCTQCKEKGWGIFLKCNGQFIGLCKKKNDAISSINNLLPNRVAGGSFSPSPHTTLRAGPHRAVHQDHQAVAG